MKHFTSLLGAVLLAASTAVLAQAPAPAPKAGPKAESPKREAFRQAREKARKACEGKPAGELRECMRRETCAQSKDPAACEARAKVRTERRAKMQEACKGKSG